jgi:hypothetical protein
MRRRGLPRGSSSARGVHAEARTKQRRRPDLLEHEPLHLVDA